LRGGEMALKMHKRQFQPEVQNTNFRVCSEICLCAILFQRISSFLLFQPSSSSSSPLSLSSLLHLLSRHFPIHLLLPSQLCQVVILSFRPDLRLPLQIQLPLHPGPFGLNSPQLLANLGPRIP
jgi:hypothetical protein